MLLFTSASEALAKIADYASADGRVSKENVTEVLYGVVKVFSVIFGLLGIVVGMLLSAVMVSVARMVM